MKYKLLRNLDLEQPDKISKTLCPEIRDRGNGMTTIIKFEQFNISKGTLPTKEVVEEIDRLLEHMKNQGYIDDFYYTFEEDQA